MEDNEFIENNGEVYVFSENFIKTTTMNLVDIGLRTS